MNSDLTPAEPVRRLAGRSVAALAVGAIIAGGIAPTVLAADRQPASTSPATNDAAGDNQTVIDVAAEAAPAVVTIVVQQGGATAGDSGNGDNGNGDGGGTPDASPLPSPDLLAPDPNASPIPGLGGGDEENGEGGEGNDPFNGQNPFGNIDPFNGQNPFGGQGPFGGGVLQGSGSGVIIDSDGLILTNRHVVDGAETVTVILKDGRELPGTVKGIDTYTDFALVKVDATDLPTIELGDSSNLKVGQLTVAIGNPEGRFPGTVSSGIVSGLDRSISVADMTQGASRLSHLIQTDAAINPGNSGGALLDGDGKLIGINTAMAGGAQGIGFALPIDIAKPIVEQIRAGQEIARPWMGVTFQQIDAQVAKDQKLPVEVGAWIHAAEGGTAVVDGSPAADAGLKAEDIITKVNGIAIDQTHPLDLELLTFSPGQTVTITVLRDGTEQELQLTLGTRPADLGR